MERWNRALDLLEEQLDADVDVARVARAALTSEYHFRRTFAVLAGMPLGEYVRRRRLTLATAEVLAGDASLLDIATRWGWGSDDAFRRAFRALHGMAPDEARRPGAVLRSQPQVRFHLRIEGRSDMRHRIEHLPAFRLVGRKARVPLVHEGPNEAIIEFVRSIPAEETERLRRLRDVGPSGIVSVSDAVDEARTEGSELDYWHAVATTQAAPPGFDALEVDAGTWVVFEGEGPLPEALQALWAESFSEWFPSNPYRVVPGPEILSTRPAPDWSTGRGELWIPVERES